jgi:hypothetical protein
MSEENILEGLTDEQLLALHEQVSELSEQEAEVEMEAPAEVEAAPEETATINPIESIVDDAIAGNYTDAGKTLASVMDAKVSDVLDMEKVSIAASLYQ